VTDRPRFSALRADRRRRVIERRWTDPPSGRAAGPAPEDAAVVADWFGEKPPVPPPPAGYSTSAICPSTARAGCTSQPPPYIDESLDDTRASRDVVHFPRSPRIRSRLQPAPAVLFSGPA